MKSLQAYFTSMCEAHMAAKALAEAGYGASHLDLAGVLDYEYSEEISALKAGGSTPEGPDHLAGILMNLWSRGLYDSRGIAAANIVPPINDPVCEEGEVKISTRLILKMPEGPADAAYKIITENGGRIFPFVME